MDGGINRGLFAPLELGGLQLSHRVVHAPMTRLRSEPDDTPSAMMVDYYRQRASQGGLMITEFDSRGYIGAPGYHIESSWRP